MPVIPTIAGGTPQLEINRIARELDRLQAEVIGTQLRGTSAKSVHRHALARVGAQVRSKVRATTPRRTGFLASTTRGKFRKSSRFGRLVYQAGWDREVIEGRGGRWQQAVANEHGTARMRGSDTIKRALVQVAGSDGQRLIAEYLRELEKRVKALVAKANAGRRR